MNDYELYTRCLKMLKDVDNDCAWKYIQLAKQHFRRTEGHEFLADELDREIDLELHRRDFRRVVEGALSARKDIIF